MTKDQKSRGVGFILLLAGVLLTWLSWDWAHSQAPHTFKAAAVGPVVAVLGVGMLLHGARIPTTGATLFTRTYGIAGSLAAIGYLYFLGFFSPAGRGSATTIMRLIVPAAMLGVWFLPSRAFGAEEHPHAEPGRAND